MINPIKEWILTPEQIANYIPGMDLGTPDRVYQPESYIKPGNINPTIVSANSQMSFKDKDKKRHKRDSITKDDYAKLKASGASLDEICEKYKVKESTLLGYLSKWGLRPNKAQGVGTGEEVQG